jgi:4-hydroxy 2-oxovalerate aldolase
MRNIKLIDTTLRDGSYAINFSFTLNQNEMIAKGLDGCGIKYIEVAHGVGLNASNMGFGEARHSDREYIESAVGCVKDAKIGVFCIPKVATLDDISRAHDSGVKFIRIGTNATEVVDSEQYVKKAKSLGLRVFANYMKSYCISPNDFADNVKISEDFGVDGVYIVDSAGGMFKEDIFAYYQAIRKVSELPVGFHAHDNLGLAIANNLSCIEMGVNFIDSSLQGLGRSSGNAPTEIMILALLKKGIDLNVDYLKLQELGHELIRPLISVKGKDPLDSISGFADFHSSYMGYIEKYSNIYNINPLSLIVEYTKYDKVSIDEVLLEQVAQNIQKVQKNGLKSYDYTRYFGNEQK